MDGAIGTSISLLVLWLFCGIVFWHYQRKRRLRRQAREQVDLLLEQWMQSERRRGTEPEILLSQVPIKREEFEQIVNIK